jgi:two-component system phosphate regulon response regulator PhoB
MSKECILIIEDDESMRDLLVMMLTSTGYENVKAAATGGQGLELARTLIPDLILLDLMLPEIGGLEICSLLRSQEETKFIPIIMLTAKSEESDIVQGLNLGANDYVTKPFSRRILLARIRSQLRHFKERLDNEALTYANLELNSIRHTVTMDGVNIDVTAGEFALLELFLRNPGRVFTRQQIVHLTRGEDYTATDRTIDVQLVYLRRKLGQLGSRIESIRGVGYRLAEVEQ